MVAAGEGVAVTTGDESLLVAGFSVPFLPRTSHATWLKLVGADVKDAQAQMRHSRASTTLEIYQQFVPESQKRVVERLSTLSQLVH